MKCAIAAAVCIGVWAMVCTHKTHWDGPSSSPLTIVIDIDGETADEYADNVGRAVSQIDSLGYSADLIDR